MRRFFSLCWLCLSIISVASAAEMADRLIRETEPLSGQAESAGFRVPEGFSVQLFASEPMIHKPINMAFDARGRLWVSSTVEYPYAAARERWSDALGTRVEGSRDAIKILEDTDGDGQADKVTDFADGLNIPTGVLPWHKPEHHDGCIAWSIPNIWYFADTDGDGIADLREVLFGPLGYEKDTHGMCSSFRLGLDGWVYATHGFNNTSHFEAKDGSTLELQSGNVFRFRPDGSRVEAWSSGQVNPFGLCWDRRRNLYSADCHSNPITQLLRGACYPSFGKPHDGLGFAPVMCAHSHGSTGLCGIVYIDGGVWGEEWENHMLLGNCVTSKVNHDRITFTGTTPTANELPDFLTSEDPWFRPVDLQLGPDNALYIADFYNRIIGHYEVPLDHPGRDRERGRIWRVVKADASTVQRSLSPPQPATPADLASDDPWRVRAAAAWYSEHPDRSVLPAVGRALQAAAPEDAQLTHQLRLALRDGLRLPGAFAESNIETFPEIQTLALAVHNAEAATFLLLHGDLQVVDVLKHVARWGDAQTLAKLIAKVRGTGAMAALAAIAQGLEERGEAPPPPLLAWAGDLAQTMLREEAAPAGGWEVAGGKKNSFAVQERRCANGLTVPVVSSLNHAIRDAERQTGVLRSPWFAAPARVSFWICGHQGHPKEPANHQNFVRLIDEAGQQQRQAFPPRNDVCQKVEWDLAELKGARVRIEIVDGDDGASYAWLGVTRFEPEASWVADFAKAMERHDALRVVAEVTRNTAPVELRERLAAYLPAASAPPPVAVDANQRRAMDALIQARLEAFAAREPNAEKGRDVFATNCAVCHQIQGEGALIGPQLDGIKARGVARLCEDILDPSRNVDAHFHLHLVRRQDGRTTAGFLRGEPGQVMELVDTQGETHRVPKREVVEDQVTAVSIMPAGFGQILSEQQFTDLLGWLMTQ